MADQPDDRTPKRGLSRRGFLKGSGLATASVVGINSGLLARGNYAAEAPVYGPNEATATLRVNGQSVKVLARPDETLAETLRDRLDLTGTKIVCGRGACSACTVTLDGKTVCSCLTLTLEAQGVEIETIEGLADGEALTPVQQAFIDEDASMCGYCTPGMVMSCEALLARNPDPTLDDVKDAVRGNLCRCGTYPHVYKAALRAAAASK